MEMQRPNKPRAVKVQFRSGASVPPPAESTVQTSKTAAKQPPKVQKKPSAVKRPTKPQVQSAVRQKPHGQRAQKRAESRAELNRKLSTQTPASREQARRVKKVGGSSKNIEIKRRSNHSRQRFYVKKKRTNLMKLLLVRLVLFLIIFSLMFGIVAGIFNMRLKAGGIDEGREYILQLGEDKPEDDVSGYEPEYVIIPEGCAERNNTVYIPVSALIDLCSLTVTGTSENLRYIPRDSGGHSISFNVGSDLAYVNNTVVRMTADSFISEGKLYVPLDFFIKYAQGIIITEDHANAKITISRMNIGYDPLTDTNLYAPLRFRASAVQPLEPIAEPNY